MLIEQQCENILKKYLELAQKEYGELPQHCYKTKIEFFSDRPNRAHYADIRKNMIYINKNHTSDVEWVIFHEMEHIRVAKENGKSPFGGVAVHFYPDSFGKKQFRSGDEALTDISVENLLKRKDTRVGYYETIQLTRQLGALLGFEEDYELLNYYRIGGYEDLKELVEKTFDDENSFLYIQLYLDKLHDSHIKDMSEEFKTYGEIKNKPLGSLPSENTLKLRTAYHDYIFTLLEKLRAGKNITSKEYEKRLANMETLSPYKNDEFKNE